MMVNAEPKKEKDTGVECRDQEEKGAAYRRVNGWMDEWMDGERRSMISKDLTEEDADER